MPNNAGIFQRDKETDAEDGQPHKLIKRHFCVTLFYAESGRFNGNSFVSDFLPCAQNKYAQFVHNHVLKDAGIYGIIGM